MPLLEIEKALAKKRQSKGGKSGRDLQLGLAPDDVQPPIEPRVKATEVVAKKVGLSTRTFERGKKIIEKASEDDKQKLREGKVSIAKVYQEIVSGEKPEEPTEQPIALLETERDLRNKADLFALLERLKKGELFCPSCGNVMFECSKCHKTLQAQLKTQIAKDKADSA